MLVGRFTKIPTLHRQPGGSLPGVFERVAPGWKGLDVLDLGCGGGFMAEALARQGARVIGVDPSFPSLEIARKYALSKRLDINYREGKGEEIPLQDSTVDRVICMCVLEHVQNLYKVLNEVHRVLRPGGIFLFDTINRNWLARLSVVTILEGVLKIIPRGSHDYQKFIRPGEIQNYLQENGFSVKSKSFCGMGPVGINRQLDLVFGLIPVTWILYIGYSVANGRSK